MANELKKKYQIQQKTEAGQLILHPETEATIVEVSSEKVSSTNVAAAIDELYDKIESQVNGVADVTVDGTTVVNEKGVAVISLSGKVDKVEGKSLVDDTEITKLADVSEGANKVEASETNGNIKIDGVETTVFDLDSEMGKIKVTQPTEEGELPSWEVESDGVAKLSEVQTAIELTAAALGQSIGAVGQGIEELAGTEVSSTASSGNVTLTLGGTVAAPTISINAGEDAHIVNSAELEGAKTAVTQAANGYTDGKISTLKGELENGTQKVHELAKYTDTRVTDGTLASILNYTDSKAAGVATNVAYDAVNKKLTQKVGDAAATDIVTVATLKTDLGIATDIAAAAPTSIELTMDEKTFVVKAKIKNAAGTVIAEDTTGIDLPLESVVVSGRYDSITKKVILTLKDGSTVDFSVADLVAGLQSEITENNKLASDLVDDSTSANKFVTAAEKAQITTNATAITNIENGTTAVGNASKLNGQEASYYAAASRVEALEGKFTGAVTDGNYSVVQVTNGIVTGAGQVIEVGANPSATPSANLVIGGLFFKELA